MNKSNPLLSNLASNLTVDTRKLIMKITCDREMKKIEINSQFRDKKLQWFKNSLQL